MERRPGHGFRFRRCIGTCSTKRKNRHAAVAWRTAVYPALCIWHKNADIFFNGQNYTARVLKKELYNNPTCIQEFDGYRKAMPERALCDLVYLRPKAQFDNPQYFKSETSKVRFEMLLPLYPKTTQKKIISLINQEL